jgi:hypothetical protein
MSRTQDEIEEQSFVKTMLIAIEANTYLHFLPHHNPENIARIALTGAKAAWKVWKEYETSGRSENTAREAEAKVLEEST